MKVKIEVSGNDIIVSGGIMTWFGGDSDPEDDGQTASGFSTKANLKSKGCALPKDIGKQFKPTYGSGIPNVPYLILVEITRSDNPNVKITVPVIDIGPNVSKYPTHYLDVTPEAFKDLGGEINGNPISVTYRIIDGAKYTSKPIA